MLCFKHFRHCLPALLLLSLLSAARADDDKTVQALQKRFDQYRNSNPGDWRPLERQVKDVRFLSYDPSLDKKTPSLVIRFTVVPGEKVDAVVVRRKLREIIVKGVVQANDSPLSQDEGKALLQQESFIQINPERVPDPLPLPDQEAERQRNEAIRQANEAARQANEAERQRNEAARQRQMEELRQLLRQLRNRSGQSNGGGGASSQPPSQGGYYTVAGWWGPYGCLCYPYYYPIYVYVAPRVATAGSGSAPRANVRLRPSGSEATSLVAASNGWSDAEALVSRTGRAATLSQEQRLVRAIKKGKPADSEAYYWHGRTKFWERDLDTAWEDFAVAALLYPQDARFWYFKGLAEYDLGEVNAARSSFDRGAALQYRAQPDETTIGLALERIQGPRRQLIQDALLRAKRR